MLRYKTIESLIDLKIKEGSQVLHPCKPSLNSAFNCCYVLRDGASVKTNIGFFLGISKFCLFFEVELFAFPDIHLRTTCLALVLVLRHVGSMRVAVLAGCFISTAVIRKYFFPAVDFQTFSSGMSEAQINNSIIFFCFYVEFSAARRSCRAAPFPASLAASRPLLGHSRRAHSAGTISACSG